MLKTNEAYPCGTLPKSPPQWMSKPLAITGLYNNHVPFTVSL